MLTGSVLIPLRFQYPLQPIPVPWSHPDGQRWCIIDQAREVLADCHSELAANELIFLANFGYEKLTNTPDNLGRPEA